MFIPSGFSKTAILATAGLLFLLFVLLLGCWQQLPAGQQELLARLIADNSGFTLLFLTLLCSGWIGGIVLVYHWWIKPVHTLADELLLILSVNPSYRVGTGNSRGLTHLAELINEGADRYQSLEKTAEDRLSYQLETMRQETNMLHAVLVSLAEGIVICTTSATVIYVNARACDYLDCSTATPGGSSERSNGASFLGPGRDLSAYLDMIELQSILSDIGRRYANGCRHQGHQVTVIGPNGHFLAIDIAPLILADAVLAGYVIKLNPVSTGPAGDDLHLSAATMPSPWCSRDEEMNECASGCLARRLVPTQLDRLLAAIGAQLPLTCDATLRLDTVCGSWQFPADIAILGPALCRLLQRAAVTSAIREFRVRTHGTAEMVCCDILWPGRPPAADAVLQWLKEKIDTARTPSLSIDAILQLHGIRWSVHPSSTPPGDGFLRLLLPGSGPAGRTNLSPVQLIGGNSLFSDFDLYTTQEYSPDLDRELLANLTYTVFDLETTGLDPLTDEIISIGAVRCAHGKMMPGEPFAMLVDPGRDIPEESRRIHGLDRNVLQGQPTIDTALPTFHRFAAGTVLVGHNVAFDMRMLQMKRYVSELRFTQPVLDTMHLAAIIHPFHRNHSLEAVSRRLGVRITGRHTAVGDAIAAAEILNKCLPLLARANILTLGDARRASRKTRYSRMVY